jgi:hypothetical protein
MKHSADAPGQEGTKLTLSESSEAADGADARRLQAFLSFRADAW